MRVCPPDHPDAETARTRYRSLAVGEDAALMELKPDTGRMHQLRVHLASIGRPIAGDARYGGVLMLTGQPVPRLMLHAAALSFPHPSGERMSLVAPAPADFQALADGCDPPPASHKAAMDKKRSAPLRWRPARRTAASIAGFSRRWLPEPCADPQADPLGPDPRRWRAGQTRDAAGGGRPGARAAAAGRARARRAQGQALGPRRGLRPLPGALRGRVLALNKPRQAWCRAAPKTSRHIDRLLSAWGEGVERPKLVHRLDRDTTGVLVLGKTPAAAARLAGQQLRQAAGGEDLLGQVRRPARKRRRGGAVVGALGAVDGRGAAEPVATTTTVLFHQVLRRWMSVQHASRPRRSGWPAGHQRRPGWQRCRSCPARRRRSAGRSARPAGPG